MMMLYTLLLLSSYIVAFRPPQRCTDGHRRDTPQQQQTLKYIESTDCFK